MSEHEEVCLEPIGVAHTPYETPADAPHQGFTDEAEATVELHPEYADGLAGIDDVLRVTVLYWADRADRSRLAGEDGVGAFARRTPHRPNPINLCTCFLLGREGRRLRVTGLDAVDGSPVIDVKPALQAER